MKAALIEEAKRRLKRQRRLAVRQHKARRWLDVAMVAVCEFAKRAAK